MRRAAALLVLLLALTIPVAAGAAGGTTATAAAATPRVNFVDIEQQVMCVVCKTPLNIANGPQADSERAEIRGYIAQGMTERQIKDRLVAEYGDRVLALPKDKGFNLAVYLVPVAAAALALGLLAVMLPRWRRAARARATAAGPAALAPELSPEDARRLDEDLSRYDG